MLEKSEEIKDLAMALAKAQSKFTNIFKSQTAKIQTKSGASYSYSYADLAELLDEVREPLTQNGLAIVQCADVLDGRLLIETMLLHSTGQWIRNKLSLPIVDTGNNAIQAIGSSITYGRRYELGSILGIASEKDDDANAVPARQMSPPQSTTNGNKAETEAEKAARLKKIQEDERLILNGEIHRAKKAFYDLTKKDDAFYRIFGENGLENEKDLAGKTNGDVKKFIQVLNDSYKQLKKDLGK